MNMGSAPQQQRHLESFLWEAGSTCWLTAVKKQAGITVALTLCPQRLSLPDQRRCIRAQTRAHTVQVLIRERAKSSI